MLFSWLIRGTMFLLLVIAIITYVFNKKSKLQQPDVQVQVLQTKDGFPVDIVVIRGDPDEERVLILLPNVLQPLERYAKFVAENRQFYEKIIFVTTPVFPKHNYYMDTTPVAALINHFGPQLVDLHGDGSGAVLATQIDLSVIQNLNVITQSGRPRDFVDVYNAEASAEMIDYAESLKDGANLEFFDDFRRSPTIAQFDRWYFDIGDDLEALYELAFGFSDEAFLRACGNIVDGV